MDKQKEMNEAQSQEIVKAEEQEKIPTIAEKFWVVNSVLDKVEIAQKIAKKLKIDASGYKLVINTGKHGGQLIPHLHLHLLGGEPLKGLV